PGNQIFAITQDQDGYLWIATNETLVRFDGVRFVGWNALGYTPLPATGVRALHIARDGAIWIGLDGSGGVSRLFKGHLTNFTPADGIPRGAIMDLFEDRRGAIWAGGPEGLARFEQDRWELIRPAQSAGPNGIFGIFEDEDGGLLVGLPGEVRRRD